MRTGKWELGSGNRHRVRALFQSQILISEFPVPSSRHLLAFVFLAASLACVPLRADDTSPAEPTDEVVVRSKSGGRLVQKGTILDFTGRELTLRITGGREQNFAADDIVAVRTPRSEHHLRGEAALRDGRYEEAARELELAVNAERRQWVRRDVLALLVRTALTAGDRRLARSRFELLLESDPHSRHFALIPCDWAADPVDAATAQQARRLLVHELEGMRLVGASLLLGDADNGDEAARVLKSLERSLDDRIRSLAIAQNWRARLGVDLSEHEVAGWQRSVDRIPEDLRAGPSYVLGRGWVRAGLHDRAAVALLWAPVVADHDALLAARCLVEAAESLRRIGQDNRAFTLYREAVARYGHTPFADEARSAIAEMTAPRDDLSADEDSAIRSDDEDR